MPAKSKKQQRFMGMVHAVQKGELSRGQVGASITRAADRMSMRQAHDYASTKHKGLPEKTANLIKLGFQATTAYTEIKQQNLIQNQSTPMSKTKPIKQNPLNRPSDSKQVFPGFK